MVMFAIVAVLVFATAVLLGLWVHLLKVRSARDLAWSGRVATELGRMGDAPFKIDGEGHVRGLVHGRPTVVALTGDRFAVVIMRLHMPIPDVDAPKRPSLRGLDGPEGHRIGQQWVQVWQARMGAAQIGKLVATALGLAQAAEAQAAAPWALFAGQNGLSFHEGRVNRPCFMQGEVDGVHVRVQLAGLREPPLQTLIVAGRGRPRRSETLGWGGADVLSGASDMGALFSRYADADIDENTVKIKIPGMVTDGLSERLRDAVALSRALGRGAWS